MLNLFRERSGHDSHCYLATMSSSPPPIKKYKVDPQCCKHVSLESLDTDVFAHACTFLTPLEQTRLSHVNRLRGRVEDGRGPMPHLLQERRLQTRLGYPLPEDVRHLVPMHQIQPFTFVVRSNSCGLLRVELKLLNLAWLEDGFHCHTPQEVFEEASVASSTTIECRVTKNDGLLFEYDSGWHRTCLHEAPSVECRYCTDFFLKGLTSEQPNVEHRYQEGFTLPPTAEVYLRASLSALALGCQRLVEFGPQYPTPGYVLTHLAAHLERFVPEGVDLGQTWPDRPPALEIRHGAPSSPDEWLAVLARGQRSAPMASSWREIDREELVWYQRVETAAEQAETAAFDEMD